MSCKCSRPSNNSVSYFGGSLSNFGGASGINFVSFEDKDLVGKERLNDPTVTFVEESEEGEGGV